MASLETIDELLAEKKANLAALRPIARASVAALAKWYDVELTYTSNAIEGNTLTRSETAIVLEKGITVNGKSLRDHMEAVGHKDALEFVRTWYGEMSRSAKWIFVKSIGWSSVARILTKQGSTADNSG